MNIRPFLAAVMAVALVSSSAGYVYALDCIGRSFEGLELELVEVERDGVTEQVSQTGYVVSSSSTDGAWFQSGPAWAKFEPEGAQ